MMVIVHSLRGTLLHWQPKFNEVAEVVAQKRSYPKRYLNKEKIFLVQVRYCLSYIFHILCPVLPVLRKLLLTNIYHWPIFVNIQSMQSCLKVYSNCNIYIYLRIHGVIKSLTWNKCYCSFSLTCTVESCVCHFFIHSVCWLVGQMNSWISSP